MKLLKRFNVHISWDEHYVTGVTRLQQYTSHKGLEKYFLRRLRAFNICRKMLKMFYESAVTSVLLCIVVFCGSRLKFPIETEKLILKQKYWILFFLVLYYLEFAVIKYNLPTGINKAFLFYPILMCSILGDDKLITKEPGIRKSGKHTEWCEETRRLH